MSVKAVKTKAPARQRIVDAFWELLAQDKLAKITVGMIIGKAGVSRPTFYYHYESLDDLLEQTMRELVFESELVAAIAAAGLEGRSGKELSRDDTSWSRFALVISNAGGQLCREKFELALRLLFSEALGCEGEGLAPESCEILRFLSAGIVGSVDAQAAFGQSPVVHTFLVDVSRSAMRGVAQAQGLTVEEVAIRVGMFVRMQRRMR